MGYRLLERNEPRTHVAIAGDRRRFIGGMRALSAAVE
jgi:hypothetical protein